MNSDILRATLYTVKEEQKEQKEEKQPAVKQESLDWNQYDSAEEHDDEDF